MTLFASLGGRGGEVQFFFAFDGEEWRAASLGTKDEGFDPSLAFGPAHQVVVCANRFPCEVRVARDDLEVDAKSIISLMLLAAEKGVHLRIRAEGPQAREAVAAIVDLFRSGCQHPAVDFRLAFAG